GGAGVSAKRKGYQRCRLSDRDRCKAVDDTSRDSQSRAITGARLKLVVVALLMLIALASGSTASMAEVPAPVRPTPTPEPVRLHPAVAAVEAGPLPTMPEAGGAPVVLPLPPRAAPPRTRTSPASVITSNGTGGGNWSSN